MRRPGVSLLFLFSRNLFFSSFFARQASRILSLRNVGLAQLEEDKPKEARATFAKLAELVPGEALPLANGAIAALREKDLPAAEALLAKAQALGERADLYAIRAALENERNRPAAVRAALEKAATLDPRDLESRWRFARSVETDPSSPHGRQDGAEDAPRRDRRAGRPSNLPARLKLLVLEGEAGDAAALSKGLAELDPLVSDGDARARQFLSEARALAAGGDAKGATVKVRVLENVLRVTPRYQQSLAEVFTQVVGLPVERFSSKVEEGLRARGGRGDSGDVSRAGGVRRERGEISQKGGPRELRDGHRLSGSGALFPAVFFDFDLDGDLDVYLPGGSQPDQLLRNNLDGTFTDVTAKTGDAKFASKKAVVSDVDRDGDPDLVTIDAKGELVLRLNLRQGVFKTVPLHVSGALDVAVEDVNGDGIPDILVATSKGLRLLMGRGDGDFLDGTGQEFAAASGGAASVAPHRSRCEPWCSPTSTTTDSRTSSRRRRGGRAAAPSATRAAASSRSGPSSLHLLRNLHLFFLSLLRTSIPSSPSTSTRTAISTSSSRPAARRACSINDGGNANGWLVVVLEGLPTGSGKVNKQGVGSLVEVKAGNLYVARTVGLLPTHVGLGARTKADVVRATWTNGVPQNALRPEGEVGREGGPAAEGLVPVRLRAERRRRASGRSFPTRSGARRSDSSTTASTSRAGTRASGCSSTERLFGRMPPGRLQVDYTEELWEVAFLDEATLMAVDHPDGTGVVPNERTIPGVTEKKIFTVAHPRPLRAATSDASGRSEDVTERLARRDQVYVNPGPEMFYQGVRKEHSLVLDLGDVSAGDRVVLFLSGWIFYTDTSINVSLSQRKDLAHFPPVLEVPDGAGGWKVAMESFGFPAGKTKTMPVDLTGLVDPKDPRVRIRTTMAIFWDEAFVTVNDPAVEVVTTLLSPASAVLSERGFPRGYRETPDGPEVFDHGDVSTPPRWEDVPGRVTRLGDVTELLAKADDRWVAFKGGDAIRIAYDASKLPPLAAGWRRDLILVSDGWDKDFDKNTVTGQTVGPWPFHAMSAYPYPETEHHPDPRFLEETLTREVGPERFRKSLGER